MGSEICFGELEKAIVGVLDKKVWSSHEYKLYDLLWGMIRKFQVPAKQFSKRGSLNKFVTGIKRLDWFVECKMNGLFVGLLDTAVVFKNVREYSECEDTGGGRSDNDFDLRGIKYECILLVCEYQIAFVVRVVRGVVSVFLQRFVADGTPVLKGEKCYVFGSRGTKPDINGIKEMLTETNDAWKLVGSAYIVLFCYELLKLFDEDKLVITMGIYEKGVSISDIAKGILAKLRETDL